MSNRKESCDTCEHYELQKDGLAVCHAAEFNAEGKRIFERRTSGIAAARSDGGICKEDGILYKKKAAKKAPAKKTAPKKTAAKKTTAKKK